MVWSLFFPVGTVRAAEDESARDVFDQLTDVSLIVCQKNQKIPENGDLTSTDPVSVSVSFRVPVAGDLPAPEHPVQWGDTAVFPLSDAFQLTAENGKILALKQGSIVVGHVRFDTDADTRMVRASVTFDGAKEVFSEDGGYNTVVCDFQANLQYDATGASEDGEEKTVQILDKSFQMHVPPVEKNYQVTKTGTADLKKKTVQWTVKMSGTQGKTQLDLQDFQFSDDLSGVGTYVKDSFQVNGKAAAPDWSEDGICSYTFPENSVGTQTVTFQTEIPDDKYYGSGQQSITNTAQLLDADESSVGEAEAKADFTPQWITKTGEAKGQDDGGKYLSKGRTIVWTITANQMGAKLPNVVITDVLPEGLTWKSAAREVLSQNGSWENSKSIQPNEKGEYSFGTIDAPIRLTLVTAVADETYTTGSKTYLNSAGIRWDGLKDGSIQSGSAEAGNVPVQVGYDAFVKSGRQKNAKGEITWKVGVDLRSQDISHVRVCDLLVYGDTLDGSKITGLPDGIAYQDLTAQYHQKYEENSFQNDFGGSLTVHPILQDGVRVADLLEVTGITNTKPASFTFDTQLLDPDIYAGNKTISVPNTAVLFQGNTRLNSATAFVPYQSSMLAKEMLKRGTDPVSGVNSGRTQNANEGFDYQDKSVVFRFSVNADSMDVTNMKRADGAALGKALLSDRLPDGWEFTKFASGADYLIFNGEKGSGSSVTAIGDPLNPDTISGFTADLKPASAVFTFGELKTPYVILVRARPTAAAAAGYFSTNQTVKVQNSLSLQTDNWAPGISTGQDVSIVSTILDKTVCHAAESGTLTWTLDYKPYDLPQQGQRLEDTLPLGMDLRTDSKGNLLLSDSSGANITAHEMTLNADGSYTEGAPVPLEAGKNVSYANAGRILSFTIPDPAKAYRFTYVTDITGEPGEVSNHVSLIGSTAETVHTQQSYLIADADGRASLKRGGWILVRKTGSDGAPLAGAEFAVCTPDGKTEIRKGVTGSDGTVRLRVIPDGTYLLRETKAPEGYVIDRKSHTLTVSSASAVIDGKTGEDANTVSVQDFQTGTVGDLILRKTVEGSAGDRTKAFAFTVTFSGPGADGAYSYLGEGVPDGTIRSGESVSLAHGQSVTITGLPNHLSYAVSEEDYSGDGYTAAGTGTTGVIAADTAQVASFTNTRQIVPGNPGGSHGGGGGGGSNPEPSETGTGRLTVRKTVTGPGADLSKKFAFVLTFSGADGVYPYTGAAEGTLRSGDTVFLANGESITVSGLPAGAGYTVTESASTAAGYDVFRTDDSGVIAAGEVRTASFLNRRTGGTETNPKLPAVPIGSTGGPAPQNPAAAVTGQGGMPMTGDRRPLFAGLSLLAFSAALAVLSAAALAFRRKDAKRAKHF